LGTIEIMDKLRSYGFQPIALMDHKETDIDLRIKARKIEYQYLLNSPALTRKEILQFFLQVFRLRKILVENKISLIHLNDLETGHFGILSALLASIPSILHIRSVFWTKSCGWINRLILSQASEILANSKFVHKATIEKGLSVEKVFTIYNGVELKLFELKETAEQRARKIINIPIDRLTIGFIGRLGLEWKNEPLVYQLAGELNNRMKEVTLIVIGGPSDGNKGTFDRCRKNADKMGGTADIRFLGNRSNVPEILPAIDVLLVPSNEEPFGRVVIEGMAAGLTVIGSDNGGIPEIITDGKDGFLRPPEDFDAWVSLLESILKNKELRKRIGENARKTVEERFNIDNMIDKIVKIYFRLLDKDDPSVLS